MIYVTGGTGFTGRFVVEALVAAGERCRCLARDRHEAERVLPTSVEVVAGRLDDPVSLPGLAEADAVVHVAPIALCAGVVDACERVGVTRGVYFSSTWRFLSVRTSEVDAVVEGEERVMSAGSTWTLIRPTMIYGPGDQNICRLRDLIRRHAIVPVLEGGRRLLQPVFVEDVAQVVADVVRRESTHGRAYEIAGPEPMSYGRVVDRIAMFEKRTIAKLYLPGSLCAVGARLYGMVSGRHDLSNRVDRMREDRAFSIEKAREDFAYAPRDFDAGLARTRSLESGG